MEKRERESLYKRERERARAGQGGSPLGICRHVPVLVGRTRQAESFALLFVSYQSLSWLWFWVCNSWLGF